MIFPTPVLYFILEPTNFLAHKYHSKRICFKNLELVIFLSEIVHSHRYHFPASRYDFFLFLFSWEFSPMRIIQHREQLFYFPDPGFRSLLRLLIRLGIISLDHTAYGPSVSRPFDMARIFTAPRSTHWTPSFDRKKIHEETLHPCPLFAPRRTNLLLQALESMQTTFYWRSRVPRARFSCLFFPLRRERWKKNEKRGREREREEKLASRVKRARNEGTYKGRRKTRTRGKRDSEGLKLSKQSSSPCQPR